MIQAEDQAPRRITCILPKGRANLVLHWLHEVWGANAANVTGGRGRGVVESISYGEWEEVEILTVIVGADEAEALFEDLYHQAEICHPHSGLMHMAKLDRRTAFALPRGVADEEHPD